MTDTSDALRELKTQRARWAAIKPGLDGMVLIQKDLALDMLDALIRCSLRIEELERAAPPKSRGRLIDPRSVECRP